MSTSPAKHAGHASLDENVATTQAEGGDVEIGCPSCDSEVVYRYGKAGQESKGFSA
jgi:hypothetical protein